MVLHFDHTPDLELVVSRSMFEIALFEECDVPHSDWKDIDPLQAD